MGVKNGPDRSETLPVALCSFQGCQGTCFFPADHTTPASPCAAAPPPPLPQALRQAQRVGKPTFLLFKRRTPHFRTFQPELADKKHLQPASLPTPSDDALRFATKAVIAILDVLDDMDSDCSNLSSASGFSPLFKLPEVFHYSRLSLSLSLCVRACVCVCVSRK